MDRKALDRRYRTRKCVAAGCGLRFPVEDGSTLGQKCPHCGQPTEWVDAPYQTFPAAAGAINRVVMHVLLDNVRSLSNVGSVFRTADGVGIEHLYLCGFTPTPKHPRLAKTALGAEQSVAWSHHSDARETTAELTSRGHRLWALEAGRNSDSVFGASVRAALDASDAPVTIVLGHEVSGVDPSIEALCERSIFIPMQGSKGSLNVGVALGVVAYTLLHGSR